jgi:indolepyruvate ferredoxin oxidoreductase alpha subunit
MADRPGRRLLSGNEAIALGAFEAGATVGCGYPGTPSTEILENFATYEGVWAQWSPNEKVALEVAAGAAMAGARTLATMKHVGLNVAADPLFTLSYTGVKGGLVIVSADDPQLFSSQNEQDNRHYARAAKVPMLEPSDSDEARRFVGYGFEISEAFDTPVILRTTTRVAHSQTLTSAGTTSPARRDAAGPAKDPAKWVMIPAHGLGRHRLVEQRLLELGRFAETFPGNRIEPGSGETGIITSGISYQYAREAFPDAPILKLGLTHPLPVGLIRAFAATVKSILVIEELDPFIEEQVKALGLAGVHGKDLLPNVGEYNQALLRRRLASPVPAEPAPAPRQVPARPPILCPGCPHRGIFHLLGKAGYFVTGDIGCYTLAAIPPLSALDSCLCMGASIGMALGVEKARGGERGRVAAVIGDSTFFHSGMTPLLDIVHNGGKTLVVVVDNSTTAMTGRQDHPGTDRNLMGQVVPKADVAKVAEALGLPVTVTQAYDLKGIRAALKEAEASGGPRVIVNRAPCVLLKREKGAVMRVDDSACKSCKACLAIGCPALGWNDDGTSIAIDAALCFGCGVCRQVCAFGAIAPSTGNGKGA